jgi:hypothetical protein
MRTIHQSVRCWFQPIHSVVKCLSLIYCHNRENIKYRIFLLRLGVTLPIAKWPLTRRYVILRFSVPHLINPSSSSTHRLELPSFNLLRL